MDEREPPIASSSTSTNRRKSPLTSSSRTICETVNGSHHYVVKGYSLVKGMGMGRVLCSDTFAVGGHEWAIYFYPDGKNPEDNAAYVSVFVALVGEGTDVRALFELTLLDQSGKGRHKVHSHFDRALDSGPYMLKYKGSMWGYKRFIRRTALETSDYLKDDSLVLHCTVGVVRTRTESPRYYSISVPPSDIGWQLKELLESEVGSDIVFEVGDETFKAHKLVLAARSAVFKAQFFGLIGDPKMDRVIIEDVEPPVFKAMLVYIYSDALPDIHELLGSVPQQTCSILIQHLLVVADRYDLDRLKLLCESKLCEELTSDTVAMTLALAEQHHCIQLKSVCLRYVSEHLGEMAQDSIRMEANNLCSSSFSVEEGFISVVVGCHGAVLFFIFAVSLPIRNGLNQTDLFGVLVFRLPRLSSLQSFRKG